jgi:hypothetical protein
MSQLAKTRGTNTTRPETLHSDKCRAQAEQWHNWLWKQETQDNATKDLRRATTGKHAQRAHDKTAVRALSARHELVSDSYVNHARDENNSNNSLDVINVRDPLPSKPTTGMVSPPPRQPQWTSIKSSTRAPPRNLTLSYKTTLVAAAKNAAPGLHELGCQACSPLVWCRRLGALWAEVCSGLGEDRPGGVALIS